ncbi:hypothetical protein BJF79_13490 [Actinomadura sp. CNU-125]|nr:hypothetical protein BJF79_13490 [Actinomadura sp. CNU-125]
MTSLHYTAGADEPLPEWQTTAATRYVQRQPDAALLLDVLGLTTAPARPDRSGQYQTHNGTWVTWTVCHECGIRAKLRLDGTFQIHPRAGRRNAGRCPASRRKPQPEGDAT